MGYVLQFEEIAQHIKSTLLLSLIMPLYDAQSPTHKNNNGVAKAFQMSQSSF